MSATALPLAVPTIPAPLLSQAREVIRAGRALIDTPDDVPPRVLAPLLSRDLTVVCLSDLRTLARELATLELMLDVADAQRAASPLDP